jgi:hypothetical protein
MSALQYTFDRAGRSRSGSEDQFQAELHNPRVGGALNSAHRRGADIRNRIGQIRMVEQVEELRAELQFRLFTYVEATKR